MAPIGILTVINALFILTIIILWLVIGWRAMRAHEDISASHFQLQRDVQRLTHLLAKQEEKQKGGVTEIDPSKLPRFKD